MTWRVLVVDGNKREIDEEHVAAGGGRTGEHYARVLQSLRPDLECTVVHPARSRGVDLPAGTGIDAFDGIAWTGSALNVYHDIPEVRAQVELARAAFVAGVPQFGSCWGLQVAATAAGGTVRVNPLGRELGVARGIALTEAGAAHPMYQGKRAPFDAIAVHMDEVSQLPAGATVLASNALSKVQAAEIRYQRGVFWGTQYHPEFDLNEIATIVLRYGLKFVHAGFFAEEESLRRYAADLRVLNADPARRDIAWLYGIGEDVLDVKRRHFELKRWLDLQVCRETT